jgi:hypothetical protein
MPISKAAQLLGRSRTTGRDLRFWERHGVKPVMIAGRWTVEVEEVERLKNG